MKSRDERQEEIRVKWIKNKCVGTITACTGFGKTRIALSCLQTLLKKYPELRYLIVVPTENLKGQWELQLDDWDMSFNGEVKVINSAIKYPYKTDILILDECHRYSSNIFSQIFEKVSYKYILGLTATFERLDGKHIIMEKYCPVIDTVSVIEATTNGWIAPYKEYAVIIDVDDIDIYKKYNKTFTSSFEAFGFNFDLAMSMLGKDGFKNRKAYCDSICKGKSHDKWKAELINITYNATAFIRAIQQRKDFINNHPAKVEITRKIIEKRPNSKILTFSNNIKMAESIGIGEVYSGKVSKNKSRAILEDFNLKETGVLSSCKKLITGADIKGLDVAIMLGIDSSETRATQSRGRVLRFEEGKQAEIFNLIINNTVEFEWLKKSHKKTPYIIIGLDGLDDVLNYKEPRPYVRKIKDFQFRF